MRPKEVTIVSILTGINAFRLVGFGFAAAALSGEAPRSEVFGGIGDGIAGLTAIFVALAILKRPSYPTWLVAIAWNVYALTDVFFANAISTFAPDAEPQSFIAYLIPLVFFVTHIVNLKLLTNPKLRDYFLSSTRK